MTILLASSFSIIADGTIKKSTKYIQRKLVYITTYGPGYDGQRTASGEIYHKNKVSVAVPFRAGQRKPTHPFGTYLKLTYKGRSILAKVTDICPAGTYDLSDEGMRKLLGRYESTKVRGYMTVVK